MRMTKRQQQAAGVVLAGALGYFTGEFLPPEVLGQLVGGLVGLV